jgi:alpha-tubulin suppressor-like RCC1 family protein
VSGLTDVTAIAVGGWSTCALKSEGTVWCWGSNFDGQLGDGSTEDRETPGPVSGLTGVTALSAGEDHACAVLSDGTVWCWGGNQFGKLGDGVEVHQVCDGPEWTFHVDCSPLPLLVAGAPSAVDVSAGERHTCIVSADGSAWCWGANESGQLGDGTVTDRGTPVQVLGLGDLTSVATGGYHTCAMQSSSRTWCWGANDVGQLGLGRRATDILQAESTAAW